MVTSRTTILVLIGLLTGCFIGMLGIGAGTVMVPLMVSLAGLTLPHAIGITLAMQTLPVGIFGLVGYARAGHVDVASTSAVGAGMLVGVAAGAFAVTSGSVPEALLRPALGVVATGAGAAMLASSWREWRRRRGG